MEGAEGERSNPQGTMEGTFLRRPGHSLVPPPGPHPPRLPPCPTVQSPVSWSKDRTVDFTIEKTRLIYFPIVGVVSRVP